MIKVTVDPEDSGIIVIHRDLVSTVAITFSLGQLTQVQGIQGQHTTNELDDLELFLYHAYDIDYNNVPNKLTDPIEIVMFLNDPGRSKRCRQHESD